MRTMANLLQYRSATRTARRGKGRDQRERFLAGSREHNKGWAWRRRCQGAGRRRAWWSGGLLRQRGGAEPYSPPTSQAQIIVERGADLEPPVRSVLDRH